MLAAVYHLCPLIWVQFFNNMSLADTDGDSTKLCIGRDAPYRYQSRGAVQSRPINVDEFRLLGEYIANNNNLQEVWYNTQHQDEFIVHEGTELLCDGFRRNAGIGAIRIVRGTISGSSVSSQLLDATVPRLRPYEDTQLWLQNNTFITLDKCSFTSSGINALSSALQRCNSDPDIPR